jgi:hypothetical protein
MGFPFRIADCVEDGRDKNHSIKIHRSPGRAAKAQENPADGNWRVRYAETIPAVGCLIHRHVDSRIYAVSRPMASIPETSLRNRELFQ